VFHRLRARQALPPFPTRRSSDLEERLQLRIFSLLSVAEPEGDGFFLPELEDSRFSQIDSGLYGMILDEDGREVWRSPSALNLARSEEHTSELQSRENLVCRLLLE